MPSITIVDDVPPGPLQSISVSATISDTNLTVSEYALSADAVCNASDFPGTSYTGATLTFNTETDNGKYVCFK